MDSGTASALATLVLMIFAIMLIAGVVFFVAARSGRRYGGTPIGQSAGLAIYESLQNRDTQAAIEEVMYTKESWRDAAKDGDDIERFLKDRGQGTGNREQHERTEGERDSSEGEALGAESEDRGER